MENVDISLSKKIKAYGGMLLIAALVFAADQLSKYWIRTHLALRETITPIPAIGSWFRIIHWKNTGVAFGLFQGNGWILTVIGIVVVIGIIIYSSQVINGPGYWRVALALELGGALGNLADRINPKLEVEGILLTMCEARTNLCKVISEQLTDTFEGQIRIFNSKIPNTVKVGESVYYSEPLLEYAPQTKACQAYLDFGKELIGYESKSA